MTGKNRTSPGSDSDRNGDSLTILRQLTLVTFINRNGGVTRDRIRQHLASCRLRVSDRQIQRDLKELAPLFGLESRKREDDNRAYWHGTGQENWRRLFATSRKGSTDRGEDPLQLDRPDSKAIVVPLDRERTGRNQLKLLRILLIYEALPGENADDDWASLNGIQHELQQLGVCSCKRTLLRDLNVIRKHFLTLSGSSAKHGRNGPHQWQRVEGGEWFHGFEPRYPETALCNHQAMHRFLYGRAPAARLDC